MTLWYHSPFRADYIVTTRHYNRDGDFNNLFPNKNTVRTLAIKRYPRVTVGGFVTDKTLVLTASRCSGKDNFCRRTGRLKCCRKYETLKYQQVIHLSPEQHANLNKTFVTIAKELAKTCL